MDAPVTLRSSEGPSGRARAVLLAAFTRGNRHVILPVVRDRCIGAWAGSPLVGYFLTLTTTGRRTGLPRQTPLNYAILDGHVYVVSGFGTRADWYRNLAADPRVVVGLPGRAVDGTAVLVQDRAEAERAVLAVARNCGFALAFEGLNPLTATDERLRTRLAGRPVVRITAAAPVRPGPHDPGSHTWVLPHVVLPVATIAMAGWWVRRRGRRVGATRPREVRGAAPTLHRPGSQPPRGPAGSLFSRYAVCSASAASSSIRAV